MSMSEFLSGTRLRIPYSSIFAEERAQPPEVNAPWYVALNIRHFVSMWIDPQRYLGECSDSKIAAVRAEAADQLDRLEEKHAEAVAQILTEFRL